MHVARRFLDTLLQPDVLRLRRLVVAEADRFPEISATWFEGAFHQSIVLLGESMTRLADRGLLRPLADPTLAAYQFAGLVMYKPMNQAMFAGTDARLDAEELDASPTRRRRSSSRRTAGNRRDQVSVSLTGALIFVPSRAKTW